MNIKEIWEMEPCGDIIGPPYYIKRADLGCTLMIYFTSLLEFPDFILGWYIFFIISLLQILSNLAVKKIYNLLEFNIFATNIFILLIISKRNYLKLLPNLIILFIYEFNLNNSFLIVFFLKWLIFVSMYL